MPHNPDPEHALQLSPSAAIPFTHDIPSAHDSKLDELRSAVADSGAEHAYRVSPWDEDTYDGDWFSDRFDDESTGDGEDSHDESQVVHDMGNAAMRSQDADLELERQEAIYDWIRYNIVNEYDHGSKDWVWKILPESGKVFLWEHQREIMEAIPKQLKYRATSVDLINILKMVAPGKTFSNEFGFRMIEEDPYLLLDNLDMFPDFVFDMDYVRAMLSDNKCYQLMSRWQLINEDCLQQAVDMVLRDDQSAVTGVMRELIDKVHFSRDTLFHMAGTNPHGLLGMIKDGLFPELKKDVEVLRRLCNSYSFWDMIDEGMLDELTIPQINQLLTQGVYLARMFRRLRDIGRINTLDDVVEAIGAFGIASIVGEVSVLPQEIQSHVFQTVATGPGDDWIRYLCNFNSLSDDDYIFILDSMPRIDEKLQSINQIVDLFRDASEHLKAKFESIYRQISQRRADERLEQEKMNVRREHQSDAERTYFEAGNVSIDPHNYHDQLGTDDIIEALEHNGCVRMAGDIKVIANDASRTNLMMCIEGSTEELTTGDLGEDADIRGTRQTVTEYEALQAYMKFIQSLPKSTYGHKESLGTELTYIGEKEYSEAVEGIALYWKWFLEKDPKSQLYLSAAVSHDGGTTKSDVYMLDRILEHFSDDDMAKYVGRILTGKDQVTQADPAKVKVVLIDDWTISGSQLRSAYGIFIEEYPHLANSIEIQLIAASRERVALGIEKVSGIYPKEGVYEMDLPTKVRAYFVAHLAESAADDARSARITGSHSSVDYGFTSDIAKVKRLNTAMPLIASVIRPYRQEGYTKVNIERLKKINEELSNAA